MSRYLLINIGIIFFPLLFSFERQLRFISKIKPVLFSQITVGAVFIIWDGIAASRGDWGFSQQYTHPFRLFYLPLEEYLFFITVSYSILFGYESIQLYCTKFSSKSFTTLLYPRASGNLLYKWIAAISALLCMAGAANYADKYYTATVLLFCAVTILLLAYTSNLLQSPAYRITLLVSYIPFFLVNYLLTAPPIVWYSPRAIIGMRVTTIPVEDFFYSFAMISLWIFAYEFAKKRFFPGTN